MADYSKWCGVLVMPRDGPALLRCENGEERRLVRDTGKEGPPFGEQDRNDARTWLVARNCFSGQMVKLWGRVHQGFDEFIELDTSRKPKRAQ